MRSIKSIPGLVQRLRSELEKYCPEVLYAATTAGPTLILWATSQTSPRLEEAVAVATKICGEYGIEPDLKIVTVDEVRDLLRRLVRNPTTWASRSVRRYYEAEAVLAAISTTDSFAAKFLYTLLLLGHWDIPLDIEVVVGAENLAKLVQEVGIEDIRRAIHQALEFYLDMLAPERSEEKRKCSCLCAEE